MKGLKLSPAKWTRLGHGSWVSLRASLMLVAVFVLSLTSAYVLRFEWSLVPEEQRSLLANLPVFVIVKFGIFSLYRVRRLWHAYVSFPELVRLGKAVVVSMTVLALVLYMAPQFGRVPRSILVLDACTTALIAGGLLCGRRFLRERKEHHNQESDSIPVVIVGVNQTGVALLRAIKCVTSPAYRPVGLITDNTALLGREIDGVRVVGRTADVAECARTLGAQTILIIAGELPGKEMAQLVNTCQADEIAVRVIPSVQQILSGHVDFKPREVAIEDLLGREPVSLDQEGLQRWLCGRRILVTGSCGSIGSEIARQLLRYAPESLTLVDRSETGQFYLEHELRAMDNHRCATVVIGDMNDVSRMQQIFETCKPEIVFHAAAYKHVPLMEQYPQEAIKNIIGATRNLVDLAVDFEVESFVMISTDKAVNPTSVMGCCKRVAELYVQATARRTALKFITVRFGNVLGSAGSVIPLFRQQIARGGPVTVTHPDMTRYFMTIPEASQLVIQAGCMGQGGEIYVLDMGNPVKIMDLAEAMVRLSGLKVGDDIEISITGLRPGEKLYEELYTDDETQMQTTHPKILIAESERVDYETVRKQIQRLLNIAEQQPQMIRTMLRQVVPRYGHDEGRELKVA